MVTGYPDFTLPVVHVGAITVEGSVSVLGTVEVKGAVTVSGAVSISGTVEVTGAVTVSGTVSISGTVEVTGSVTVSGTVSISGLVAITDTVGITGAVNIKTTYVDNIVIDKLTVGAYTEDRRTLSNNGETASWGYKTGDGRYGKFFPRGCRGFIGYIQVHSRDSGTSGGTITVYLAPHPGVGYVASADVTVPAEGPAAWRSASFQRMWNYDSMFIFVVCSSASIQFGYDDETPPDTYESNDAGATWIGLIRRCWFRAVMGGETVGDLPVSGTINIIPVPAVTTGAYTSDWVTVASLATVTLITVNGPGKNLLLMLAGNVRSMQFGIEVDDTKLKFSHHDYLAPLDWADWWTQPNYGIGVMSSYYDETNDKYSFLVTLPFKWKQKLTITVYNPSAAEGQAVASIDYDKAP